MKPIANSPLLCVHVLLSKAPGSLTLLIICCPCPILPCLALLTQPCPYFTLFCFTLSALPLAMPKGQKQNPTRKTLICLLRYAHRISLIELNHNVRWGNDDMVAMQWGLHSRSIHHSATLPLVFFFQAPT
jgi:hypothetical protein